MSNAATKPTIDLTPFCDPDTSSRYALDQPWVVDGWRYATDGRIMVRIPATGEPDSPKPPDEKKRPKDVASIVESLTGDNWQPWPAIKPCRICDGKGKHLEDCENCEGTGTCKSCNCGHKHQCGDCKGERQSLVRCDECFKSGSLDDRFGEAELSHHYAHLIACLPSVSYLPTTNTEDGVRFRFDGGEGVVMGLSQD